MSETTSKAKELKNALFYKNENAFVKMGAQETEAAYDFCEEYKSFLNEAKTEREAVIKVIELAKANGFSEFCPGTFYTEGDKIWYNNRDKSVILAVIGKRELSDGVRICAAHIDSPRLDLKQNPLVEESDLAMLKTRYYGGIKKYQWTAIPLSLHGAVIKKNGEKVTEKFDKFACRMVQHEMSHLDGDMFVDHLAPIRKKMVAKKLLNISKGKVSAHYNTKLK